LRLIESYWKAERANHHLEELKAAIADYSTSTSYILSTEDDVENQCPTMSARIKVAYCLGWLGAETLHDLNLLRDTRDDSHERMNL